MIQLFLEKGGVFAGDWPETTSDQYFRDFDNKVKNNQRDSKWKESCKSFGEQGCNSKHIKLVCWRNKLNLGE